MVGHKRSTHAQVEMNIPVKGWEQMPYFLAIVREGSLRGAAEILGTTHAKVSRHLNALEASYGMQLLGRARSGVTLTEAGKLLVLSPKRPKTYS